MIIGRGSEVHIAARNVVTICHVSSSSADDANCGLVHDAETIVFESSIRHYEPHQSSGLVEEANSQRGRVR